MQLLSADVTMFSKKNCLFFWPQKVEKTASKVAQKNSNPLLSPYFQHSPNGPNSVPKCGHRRNVCRTGTFETKGVPNKNFTAKLLNRP